MSARPRFVFVTERPPARYDATSVVLLRHLERLADLGEISCVSLTPPAETCSFAVSIVPLRKPGFLPVRRWLPGSSTINQYQKALHLHRHLKLGPADHILTCLHGRQHVLARRLASLSGAKLTCLLHDLWPPDQEKLVRTTLRRSHNVLAVSDRLADLVAAMGSKRSSVLLPIGETPLPAPAFPADADAIGIAGSIDNDYARVALRFGGPIEAVGWQGEAPPGLRPVPRFADNRQALAHLQNRCRALLVYQNPRIENYCRYAFPSRLIEFSQTGLPILIVAEPDSNLGRWAASSRWNLWLQETAAPAAFSRMCASLSDPSIWIRESLRVRELAAGEFSADRIHRALVDALLAA